MVDAKHNDIRARLESSVADFKQELGYSGHLEIADPYYAYDDLAGTQSYPFAERAGCYVFASRDGNILYVGKGSRHIGRRIWVPFGRVAKAGETDAFPNAKTWIKQNAPNVGVWAIAVPDNHWWLATALEGFLIQELKPSENLRVR